MTNEAAKVAAYEQQRMRKLNYNERTDAEILDMIEAKRQRIDAAKVAELKDKLRQSKLIKRHEQLHATLAELVDWCRSNTSPLGDNSPHAILVRAVALLEQTKK